MGIKGAAWGQLFPVILGAVAFLHLAARTFQARVSWTVRVAFHGLGLPALACVAPVLAVTQRVRLERWPELIGVVLAAGAVYAASLYLGAGREEERVLLGQAFGVCTVLPYAAYRGLRLALRRVRFLRSGWYLVHVLADCLKYSPKRVRAELEREFERQRDPWEYAAPRGQERFHREAEMLDAVRSGARFQRALEIGCAEGAFTELLAERCDSLLAVDMCPTALARARDRRSWSNHVHFGEWDMQSEPLPGSFDLIVAASVLEYLKSPAALRAARAKLFEGLGPGGYLLVGNVRLNEVIETAWWNRWFLRGGKIINAFVAQHPGLVVVATAATDSYVETLFQRAR